MDISPEKKNTDSYQEHLLGLSKAKTIDDLLERFSKLVVDEEEPNDIVYMSIDRSSKNGMEVSYIRDFVCGAENHTLKVLAEENKIKNLAKFVDVFLQIDLSSTEYRQGFFECEVDKRIYSIMFLGLGSNEYFALAWSSDSKTSLERKKQGYLQLYARQVQNLFSLLQKIDRTQAMLYRDDLTGLYNSRYLDVALESEVRRSQRFQNQFCLLFIDIDHFKPINDQYGHLSGSAVLKQIADVLRETLREVDSIVRYGGDEFVVLLLGASSSAAHLAAERIRKKIESQSFRTEAGNVVRVTASIGVAAFPEHASSSKDLLRLADEHMYLSKKYGKNRVTMVTVEGKYE